MKQRTREPRKRKTAKKSGVPRQKAVQRVFARIKETTEETSKDLATVVYRKFPNKVNDVMGALEESKAGRINAWINCALLSPLMHKIERECRNGSSVTIIERTQKRISEIVLSDMVREEMRVEQKVATQQIEDLQGRIILVKNGEEIKRVVKMIKEKIPELSKLCEIEIDIVKEEKNDGETRIVLSLSRLGELGHPLSRYLEDMHPEIKFFAFAEIKIRTKEAHRKAEENTLPALWKKQFN